MKRHGYQGIFSPKSRAKTMDENASKNVDGCAIFWKNDRITVCINFSFIKKIIFNLENLVIGRASDRVQPTSDKKFFWRRRYTKSSHAKR